MANETTAAEIAIVNARTEAFARGEAAGRARALREGAPRQSSTTPDRARAEARTAAHAEGRAAGEREGRAEGRKAGAAAERLRLKTILTSAEAKGRTDMARYLAFDTDMSATEALAMLGKAPAAAAAPLDRLDEYLQEQRASRASGTASYERGRQIALRAKGKQDA